MRKRGKNKPKPPIPRNTPGFDRLMKPYYFDETSWTWKLKLDKFKPFPVKALKQLVYKQDDNLLQSFPAEYCVYIHIRPDDNTCFYVGCGRGKRYRDLASRPKEYKYILKLLQLKGLMPIVRIIQSNMLWQDALELENKTIADYIINGTSLTNRMFSIGGTTYLKDDDGIWQERVKK